MTLEQIYENYDRQSDEFVRRVQKHWDFGLSRDEILRISERAQTAESFLGIFIDEDWWQDGDGE